MFRHFTSGQGNIRFHLDNAVISHSQTQTTNKAAIFDLILSLIRSACVPARWENLQNAWQTGWFINFTSRMVWNTSRSVKRTYPTMRNSERGGGVALASELKDKVFLFKVTENRGRLENPSAFLASLTSGHGSPWTPFDRLGHLDQCQRLLGKAYTLLSRGDKGHFWLLFRHLNCRKNTGICCQVHFSNWEKLIRTL